MSLAGLRMALVGPLPPPEGGIANQTRQLGALLEGEGAKVTIVRVNAPHWPSWVARVRGVRAAFRLIPYLSRLWQVAGRVDLFHVMANSGWSWHLFAAPAVAIARVRGVPVVVNYRGGEAATFLQRSARWVTPVLRRASVVAVPSAFLQEVFARHDVPSVVVPNIVDLQHFRPAPAMPATPHLVVARNLERMYDNATALQAFAQVLTTKPQARMTIAGAGPEEASLRALAASLAVAQGVDFCGRLDRDQMASLYRSASVVLNPSRVDNMPNSVLEAMASGVPVVSTNVGGVPFILRDGVNGLLVPPGEPSAMAAAIHRLLDDAALAARVRATALADAQQYAWAHVRRKWADVYALALSPNRMHARPA